MTRPFAHMLVRSWTGSASEEDPERTGERFTVEPLYRLTEVFSYISVATKPPIQA
jgi:hypothetical protein